MALAGITAVSGLGSLGSIGSVGSIGSIGSIDGPGKVYAAYAEPDAPARGLINSKVASSPLAFSEVETPRDESARAIPSDLPSRRGLEPPWRTIFSTTVFYVTSILLPTCSWIELNASSRRAITTFWTIPRKRSP